jgi:hypothetical protein
MSAGEAGAKLQARGHGWPGGSKKHVRRPRGRLSHVDAHGCGFFYERGGSRPLVSAFGLPDLLRSHPFTAVLPGTKLWYSAAASTPAPLPLV